MKLKESLRMIQIGTIVGSVIFLLGAIFSYTYQESSYGMLPVIHYPYREFSETFLIVSIILIILFLSITVYYETTK